MDIDVAQLVTTIKAQEIELMKYMSPEEKASYMENRAFKAEEVLAQITLEQAKASILVKYPLVDTEDLSEAKTVTEADKMAARIQAKAEKINAKFQAEQDKLLAETISPVELEKFKKAYGKPRQPVDETQNQMTDAEQKKELGKQVEGGGSPFNLKESLAKEKGHPGLVDQAARAVSENALEILLGGR